MSPLFASFRSKRVVGGVASVLAAGALLAAPVAASAQARDPVDPGVRCAAKVGPGQYEFYLPGERATDVNGNKWVCGPDGQWFRDYSALLIRAQSVAQITAARAVYAP
jgi:hypothetical protein